MKIRVQSIRFNADKKLLEFIQKKADKLDTFYDQIISGEVYLRLENVEDEANKITEIKLTLPGSQLFAKKRYWPKCRTSFKHKKHKFFNRIGRFLPADFFLKNKFCSALKMCKFAIPFGRVCNNAVAELKGGSLK